MSGPYYIKKKCSKCGREFTSSYRNSNPCHKCGGVVDIVQDIGALLEAHKEIVGRKSEEEVHYFLCLDYLSVMKFTSGGTLHCKQQGGDWHNTGRKLDIAWFRDNYPHTIYLEVPAESLPYLEKPDVAQYGETEFRKWKSGDSWVGIIHGRHGSTYSASWSLATGKTLNDYRWCKPRTSVKVCPSCSAPLPVEMFEEI